MILLLFDPLLEQIKQALDFAPQPGLPFFFEP